MAKKPRKNVGIQEKFQKARRELTGSLIERDEEIDISLTALVCQENPLFVGPPGTAKSMMLDAILHWMGKDSKKFSILFTKFTVPEEVFGPISIQGLKNDTYKRITTDMLPEAEGAFLDEIFKASSAILNTTLKILNEREYDGQKVPLKICVAASNEWPSGEELGALFDRFLFRKKVRPIMSRAGRDRLMWTKSFAGTSEQLVNGDLSDAYEQADEMDWDDRAKITMNTILDELAKEGIKPGDRRQRKAVKAAQAYAWLTGGVQVELEHLEILKHILWDEPTEQPEKCAKIISKIANPAGAIITDKIMQIQDILEKCKPTEAVPKLQAIQTELTALPRSANKSSAKRLADALDYCSTVIEEQYNRVLGRT